MRDTQGKGHRLTVHNRKMRVNMEPHVGVVLLVADFSDIGNHAAGEQSISPTKRCKAQAKVTSTVKNKPPA